MISYCMIDNSFTSCGSTFFPALELSHTAFETPPPSIAVRSFLLRKVVLFLYNIQVGINVSKFSSSSRNSKVIPVDSMFPYDEPLVPNVINNSKVYPINCLASFKTHDKVNFSTRNSFSNFLILSFHFFSLLQHQPPDNKIDHN